MSDYTTQLRFICESYANRNDKPQPQSDIDETIRLARPKLFSFDYPIFDENYREHLESKIISHFYTREIGLETVGLFKHHLKNKMREIMPYYNQLYLSEKLKFDPFMNTEMNDSRNSVRENEGNSQDENQRNTMHDLKSHSDNEEGKNYEDKRTNDGDFETTLTKTGQEKHKIAGSDVLVKHSDTPLGAINAITAVGDTSNYLSDVTQTITTPTTDEIASFDGRKDISTGVEHNESEGLGTENSRGSRDNKLDESTLSSESRTENNKETGTYDYFGRMFGKTGSETYSEMLTKFRRTFLNIDLDVIHELENLFMLVW